MGTGTSADSGAEPGIPAGNGMRTGTLADGGAEPGIPANGGTGIVPPAGGGLGLDLPPFSGGYYLLGRAGAGMPKKESDREKRFHSIPSSAAPRLQSTNDCQRQSNVGRAEETEILSFSGTCAWKMTFSFQCAPGASFPLARNGRHRRFSGAAHAPCGATFAQAIEPCMARNPPLWEKRLSFSTDESPRVPKGTRGPFHLSLLFKGSRGNYSTICWISTNSLFSRGYLMAAWAAASRARGTRKGLQET